MRVGPYRFFFYASDLREPAHIHVERDDCIAKYWLAPVRLQDSAGFRPIELQRIRRLIDERREQLLRSWNEYFKF